MQVQLRAICFQIDCKCNHFAHYPCIILNIFLLQPVFSLTLVHFSVVHSPFLRWCAWHCLTLPLPRKQMSPAPYVTTLKTAGYGRTGVERAQLPNIISFASNKTRELCAKNLRLFDKTRELSKSGRGLIHKMVDYQKEYWIIRIQITNNTCYILN